MSLQPQLLPPNVVEHWYSGGPALAAWRRIDPVGDRSPEEWLGATVHRFGDPGTGPSRLADGRLLADAITADPIGWVGRDDADVVASADTGLLVKLLDAGQRLPVHVHPTRSFAVAHLDCPYGKTEAWYVLAAEPGAAVWVGWRDDVDPAAIEALVEEQDAEAMLALLNRIEVRAGDGVLVPGGTPHAIGQGILVIEAQEPTDQSILLERVGTTAADDEIFLGLDRSLALSAIGTGGLPDVGTLVEHASAAPAPVAVPVLPPEAAPFFRMELLTAGGGISPQLAGGFAVVVVLAGGGSLATGEGSLPVEQGQVWVVPAGAGAWGVDGDASVLACRPGTTWPITRPQPQS